MSRDRIQLLFETERRLLRRRWNRLFGNKSTEREKVVRVGPLRQLPQSRPNSLRPRAAKTTDRASKRRVRQTAQNTLTLAVSIILHLTVAAYFLPHWFRKTEIARKPEAAFELSFFAKEKPVEPEPTVDPPLDEPEEKPEESEPEAPPVETPVEKKPIPESPAEQPDENPVFGVAGAGAPSPISGAADSGTVDHSVLVERYGGSKDSEVAVAAGLRWLADHQNRDGSWSAHGFSRHCGARRSCQGRGFHEHSIGVTALTLLAFLGAGTLDPEAPDSEYRRITLRGLDYLIGEQDAKGCYGPREGHYMYNHAISAFCLAEAARLTRKLRYRRSVAKALRFSARSQQPGGGWDYTQIETLRNDLSVTGWQAMAFYSAKQARVPVSKQAMAKLEAYLSRAVSRSGRAIYADRGTGEGRAGIAMVAVGLLSKLYTGWSIHDASILKAADRLVRQPPAPDQRSDWRNTFQSSYYWYYATLALFHIGGDHWEAWNRFLLREILPLQRQNGHERGSWDPDPNWIGSAGGRVASTALCVLILEVYYRFEPFHSLEQELKSDEANRSPR